MPRLDDASPLVGTKPRRHGTGIRLESEFGILLVAFRGETHIVELNFVDSGFGHELGKSDVVILRLCSWRDRSRPACRSRARAGRFDAT